MKKNIVSHYLNRIVLEKIKKYFIYFDIKIGVLLQNCGACTTDWRVQNITTRIGFFFFFWLKRGHFTVIICYKVEIIVQTLGIWKLIYHQFLLQRLCDNIPRAIKKKIYINQHRAALSILIICNLKSCLILVKSPHLIPHASPFSYKIAITNFSIVSDWYFCKGSLKFPDIPIYSVTHRSWWCSQNCFKQLCS